MTMKPTTVTDYLDSTTRTYQLLAQLENTTVLAGNSKTRQIKVVLLSHYTKWFFSQKFGLNCSFK